MTEPVELFEYTRKSLYEGQGSHYHVKWLDTSELEAKLYVCHNSKCDAEHPSTTHAVGHPDTKTSTIMLHAHWAQRALNRAYESSDGYDQGYEQGYHNGYEDGKEDFE